MNVLLKGAILASTLFLPLHAGAQEYPSQPVTILVGSDPGGSNDIIGRYIADQLTRKWGQSVVVENKPGAGGSIAAALLTQAKPDGNTLLFQSSTIVVVSATNPDVPYDAQSDIAPIAMPTTGSLLMVTGTRVPMATVDDIVKQAKEQTIFYGGNGANTSTFAAEQFAEAAGIELEQVNYPGGADILVDMAGGRVDVYIGTLATIQPFIDQGAAVPVAVLNKTRDPLLPDVPTIAEAGYPDAEFPIFWGLYGPAEIPAELREKINRDVTEVINSPESVAFLAKQSAAPTQMSVDEFKTEFDGMFTTVKGLAQKIGMIN